MLGNAPLDSVKKYYLYFDSIYFNPEHEPYLLQHDHNFSALFEKGIMKFLPVDKIKSYYEQEKSKLKNLIDSEEFSIFFQKLSLIYLEKNQIQTAPVMDSAYIDTFYNYSKDKKHREAKVLDVVLGEFPYIDDEEEPFEKIIDYKEDPDTRKKFLALRNWMIDIASKELESYEIREKLLHQLDEYRQHLEYHRMKHYSSGFQTLLSSSVYIIENLTKLNFSKVLDKVCSFQSRSIALMEAEMKLPGKELAYIQEVREKFGK